MNKAVLKVGTGTSGNFEHFGRPGLVGGSRTFGARGVSSDTSSRDYQRQRDARLRDDNRAFLSDLTFMEQIDRYDWHDWAVRKITDSDFRTLNSIWKKASSGNQLVGNWINTTYNYTDPETGYSTRVTSVGIHKSVVDYRKNTLEPDGIQVRADVLDKNGNYIGSMKRTIFNTGEIHHDYLSINDSAQGTGFGSRLYQHLENSYIKAKIKQVTIFANIDVGGYAWARMGFDFANNSSAASMNQAFAKAWENYHMEAKGFVPDTPHFTHAYEMALATTSDGFRIGKKAMLGESWDAIKYLDKSDPGFQVGQAYYAAKGKKK